MVVKILKQNKDHHFSHHRSGSASAGATLSALDSAKETRSGIGVTSLCMSQYNTVKIPTAWFKPHTTVTTEAPRMKRKFTCDTTGSSAWDSSAIAGCSLRAMPVLK